MSPRHPPRLSSVTSRSLAYNSAHCERKRVVKRIGLVLHFFLTAAGPARPILPPIWSRTVHSDLGKKRFLHELARRDFLFSLAIRGVAVNIYLVDDSFHGLHLGQNTSDHAWFCGLQVRNQERRSCSDFGTSPQNLFLAYPRLFRPQLFGICGR
jgi:hypothetical protein